MRRVTRVGAFPPSACAAGGAVGFALRAVLATAWLVLTPGAQAARAYVSNEDDNTVTVVDTQRLAAVESIAVGKRPRGLALSRDGKRLYVALSGLPKCPPPMTDADCARLPRDTTADGIAVIDTGTLRPLGKLGGVSDPERVEVSADGRTLYVSEEDSARLALIDVARGAVVGTVPVGREPEGVRVSPDGRWVLVTSEEDSVVAIIDAHKRIRLASASVGQRPRDVLITPDSRTAYVSGEADGSVFRVSLPTGAPATELLKLRSGARPMGLALDAEAGRLYVSTGRAGSVAVVAIGESRVLAEVAVGARPWGIALAEHGTQLLVATGPGADLAVVDTRALNVAGRIRAGAGAWGVVAGR